MSTQPHFRHQAVCVQLCVELELWNRANGMGRVSIAPGLIFSDDNDVAPDVVWISNERYDEALGDDGKLHKAPELVIEVLSPGTSNEKRDRELKLGLYSRRGVAEYWIVNWRRHEIEVYRRGDDQLEIVGTLSENDVLETALLPAFACPVRTIFV